MHQTSEIWKLMNAMIRSIRPLRHARKLTDAGGLYLLVALDQARLRHQGARCWLAAGIDPALKKRQLRSACRWSDFDARPQIKCC